MSDLEATIRAIVRDELAKAVQPPAAPELVTVADYARARSISVSTVRKAIARGRLSAVKIGTAVRVRAADEIGKQRRAANDDIDAAVRAYGVGSRR